MKKILTIAGSDSSGGAGIQADIKTITAHAMFAMSAITALTAQNTTGVYGIYDVPGDFIENQLDCIFTDIRPDAVKIGMVSQSEVIDAIAQRLTFYKAENIVVDPVMVATSGSKLISDEAITPNLAEAQVLAEMEIKTPDDMEAAAKKLSGMTKGAVVVKGGHLDDTADDLLYLDGRAVWIRGERINNPNTHGTGCTFSSAIACGLAGTGDIEQAVRNAKEYLSGALRDGLDLGKGSGPLNHCYKIK